MRTPRTTGRRRTDRPFPVGRYPPRAARANLRPGPARRWPVSPLMLPYRLPVRRLTLLAAGLAAAGAAACRELAFEPQDPRTVTYAPALNIDLSQFQTGRGGVYYRDVALGSGTLVDSTSTVGALYKGYLTDGRVFDSSSTTTPVSFPLATVVPGFRNGLIGARQGSRRVLVIPPSQGYGNQTTANNRIPAGSVLIFDVNLASVTTPVPTAPTTSRALGR